MNGRTQSSRRAKLRFAGVAGALAVGVIAVLPAPAQARVWAAVGAPCCGYWGPYSNYPPPYYYAPPPAYYPPPAYPAPAAPAPSAYAPQAYPPPAAAAYPPPGAPAAAPAATSPITYTSKPAFRNAAGQPCREYRTNGAAGQSVYGTACQAADGQWRVAD